ncbi:unannotated protein [freshwater metagenome]|uniref:Unannotated protein n=1 Tax=freshwater metagenome TaxID=449393 RepID=A0A6J6CIP2_9ZZZZ
MLPKLTAMRRLLISALAVSLLAGCVSGPADSAPTPTETAPPEPVFVAAPLTGVLYEEGTNPYLSLPAVMAKIDNTASGKPQLSLNDADIVFVTRIEGGMTRLLPVWHSRMPVDVGPVRSVRPVDPLLIAPFGGVFIYSGGQAPFKNAARDTGLVMSDEDTEQDNDNYYREKSRVAPWNLLFRAQKMQEFYSAQQPAPTAQFTYGDSPSAVAQGVPVLSLSVKYPETLSAWEPGTAAFAWSASSEPVWLRSQNGRIHNQQNDEQIYTKNVVVLEVTHDLSFRDPRYGPIPKAELIDNTGVAHIFTNGYYLKAVWTKAGIKSPIRLTTEAGSPVLLAAGNTWVELLDLPRSSLKVVEPEPEPTPTESTDE